jgi:hypothetical protein
MATRIFVAIGRPFRDNCRSISVYSVISVVVKFLTTEITEYTEILLQLSLSGLRDYAYFTQALRPGLYIVRPFRPWANPGLMGNRMRALARNNFIHDVYTYSKRL